MYKNTKWRDRVVDANTQEIIQEGTHMSAENFNNMENGITDAHAAFALMQIMMRNELGRIYDLCRIVVKDGEIEAGRSISLTLPDGFTRDNCCVVSVMASVDGEQYMVDNAKEYLDVKLPYIEGGNLRCVSILNKLTDRTVYYKVAVQKYK